MRDRCVVRSLTLLAFCGVDLGCGGGTTVTRVPDTPTLVVSPLVAVVPVNSTVALSSQVSGQTYGPPAWSFGYLFGGPPNPGTLSAATGNSVVYTAPATPPLYMRAPAAVQGTISIAGSVSGPFGSANSSTTVTITAASITTGIDPTAARVPLGYGTAQFFGYAVGNASNAVNYGVNGVKGGSAATGLISADGLYSAPAVLPMSGNTVTITVNSQVDPTRTSSAQVTLY